MRAPEQTVVVYEDRNDKDRLYDTAYGADNAKEVVRRCVRRHGAFANVRTRYASDFARRQRGEA